MAVLTANPCVVRVSVTIGDACDTSDSCPSVGIMSRQLCLVAVGSMVASPVSLFDNVLALLAYFFGDRWLRASGNCLAMLAARYMCVLAVSRVSCYFAVWWNGCYGIAMTL